MKRRDRNAGLAKAYLYVKHNTRRKKVWAEGDESPSLFEKTETLKFADLFIYFVRKKGRKKYTHIYSKMPYLYQTSLIPVKSEQQISEPCILKT